MRRPPDYSIKWWTIALGTIITFWIHREWSSLVSLMRTQWGPNQSLRPCGDQITSLLYQAQCLTPNSIPEWLIFTPWWVWRGCSFKLNLPLHLGNHLSCDAHHLGLWGLSFNYRQSRKTQQNINHPYEFSVQMELFLVMVKLEPSTQSYTSVEV